MRSTIRDRQPRKTKVLIVDDSAVVRNILATCIAAEPDLEVAGTAPDAFIARDKVLSLKPDVLTLDIEMPGMNGLTFLRKLMRYHPLPVVVISSLGRSSTFVALEALRCGAVDVLAKPSGPYSVGDLSVELGSKLRAAAASHVTATTLASPHQPGPTDGTLDPADPRQIIAIGASTGGTSAIQQVLAQMPRNSPGIVIAQHIPPVFSRAFADRLNQTSTFDVKEAANGDQVLPGRVLVAPGDFHMVLRRTKDGYRVEVRGGPQVCYQRPSVDVLFASVAEAAGCRATGVLLTGMGIDGAQGMLTMKNAGAHTLAQDEATSVVYGMPREAARIGAAGHVLPLSRMAEAIREACASIASHDLTANADIGT